MSAICAPPAELRGVDGYHWVQLPFVTVATPIAWMVNPDNLEREWRMPSSPAFVLGESKTARTWRYLCPVLTPAEADALQLAVQVGGRAVAELAEAEAELATLRARQAELLAALREALEALGGVLAWHLTPEQYHKHGLRAEDAASAWTEAHAAIKTARAAIAKATTP